MGIIKRIFCRHKKTVHAYALLELQEDGSFKTVHYWQCIDCGKVIKNA